MREKNSSDYASGFTVERIVTEYLQLAHGDVSAVIKYARELIDEEKVLANVR